MSLKIDEILSIDSRRRLSDGHTIPRLGLGTWRCEPEKIQNIVKEAILNHGYRHIDGAWVYKNEDEVGNGIREALETSNGRIKREDLFITTKLWNQHHVPEDVEWAFHDSLKKLRLDYIDLYLMHWPIAFRRMSEDNKFSQNQDKTVRYYAEGITLADTWQAMENLVDQKLVRSIGLSNCKPEDIDEILRIARIKPVVNQVELHPFLNQRDLRDFCAKKNIIITSYCPLANLRQSNERGEEEASALDNPIIVELAKSKCKTSAQILIRWHLQHNLTVIPRTITSERLRENSHVYDFHLTNNEMQQIDQIETNHHHYRFINPPFLKPGNKNVFDD